MLLTQNNKLKAIVILLLIICCVIFAAVTKSINHSIAPAQPQEEIHESHTTEDKSQLHIEGEDKLIEEYGSSIANSIAGQLYRSHYDRTAKLEREAELISLNKTGGLSSKITVEFIPSGDTLSATVKLKNKATNDFDIKIEGESNE